MKKCNMKIVHTKLRNELELPGTTWNEMIQQRTDTKNENFIGRNCACNTIAQ